MKAFVTKVQKNEVRKILYVKLKEENKQWLEDQVELGGFKSLYDFIDALIEQLRSDLKTKKAS